MQCVDELLCCWCGIGTSNVSSLLGGNRCSKAPQGLPSGADEAAVAAAAEEANRIAEERRRIAEEEEEKRRARAARWEADGGWRVAGSGGRVGLTNIRNTCWMNAVVQSLSQVAPFTAQFLTTARGGGAVTAATAADALSAWQESDEGAAAASAAPPTASSSSSSGGTGAMFSSAANRRLEPNISLRLRELLECMWQEQQAKPISPWRFHVSLTANSPWQVKRAFRAPQDAQEFFVFLLDALHEELTAMKKTSSSAEEQVETVDTPIQTLFQGVLQSTVTCSECGFSSFRREDYLHLSVPVRERSPFEPISLEEVFAEFFCVEELNGPNRWLCEQCGVRVDATKTMLLHRLPPVLVVHLKRFAYNQQTNKIKKVRTQIKVSDSFYDEGLDFVTYTTSSQPSASSSSTASASTESQAKAVPYDIVSVVNHHGRDAFCGHYTANCRHCVDGSWYQYDDTRVIPLEPSAVWLPADAYMLCLLRRGWQRPFGPSFADPGPGGG